MAIVNKNFRVKNGLIVDGSVAIVNGYNVLTEASTAFIISTVGGSADSANTPNTVVKRDGSGAFSAGVITATFTGNLTGDVTGTVSSIANHDTNSLAEGTGVGANLYFTNARALAATAAAYDAAGAASSAQANAATDATAKVAAEATARNSAISTAISGEVTDRDNAIATAIGLSETSTQTYVNNSVTDLTDGTTPFTAVNVNDVATVKAATVSVSSAGTVNALTWSATDYRTAKALVKFKNGVNTQVSEVLLTLDTSNNVAITEFGSIGTNGDLGTVSATYNAGIVSISVTTTYASTDVMVYATLIV